MADVINPGDVVRVTTSPGFKNLAGALTDPTTVRLKWRRFDAVTTWIFGTDAEVVKDSVGLYHANIAVTEVGMHYFRWEGEGAIAAAEEGSFYVSSDFPVSP
jgi:hypothetical protein